MLPRRWVAPAEPRPDPLDAVLAAQPSAGGATTAAWGVENAGSTPKYVILIHSNPQPWGHPTQLLTDEGRALPQERHDQMDRDFDALMSLPGDLDHRLR